MYRACDKKATCSILQTVLYSYGENMVTSIIQWFISFKKAKK